MYARRRRHRPVRRLWASADDPTEAVYFVCWPNRVPEEVNPRLVVGLDHDVPLNRRAARNLIHHRDGFDAVAGTYDDNLFDHLAEVDAVRWVGTSAMASLVSFAFTQNWVPTADDVLGTWDGVVFTVAEAEATLAHYRAKDGSEGTYQPREGGFLVLRSDGKTLKSVNYSPCDLPPILSV